MSISIYDETRTKELLNLHGKYFKDIGDNVVMVYAVCVDSEFPICLVDQDGDEFFFTYENFMCCFETEVEPCF